MKKRRLSSAMAIAAVAVGCADQLPEPQVATNGTTSASAPSRPSRRFGEFAPITLPPEASSDVRVIDGDDTDCEAEALGVVEANDADRAHAIDLMRTRAGALGAEALTAIANRGTHYTATAVRCRDLREGRDYEVLETIAIPFEGTSDTSAFDELRARAYELHADLIIDIDRGASQITGTAIRYK